MDKGITNQKSTEYERLKDLHPACSSADGGKGDDAGTRVFTYRPKGKRVTHFRDRRLAN